MQRMGLSAMRYSPRAIQRTAASAEAQRGMSFSGLLAMLAILAVLAFLVMQVGPTVLEYQAIVKATKKAAREGSTDAEVRAVFERSATVDDIRSIDARDLQITQDDGRLRASFAYEKPIHLAGPAWLLLKYSGRSQ